MQKHYRFTLAVLVAAWLSITLGPARAEFISSVVMSGLANPRGLAFGPDGSLYVAEAGSGGPGPSIVAANGQTVFYGASGAVSRWQHGVQARVLTDLPSLAPVGGMSATGLHDIAFTNAGEAYGVIGLGADPTLRANLGSVGASFAQLVRVPLGGSGPLQSVADLGAYEVVVNPDQGTLNSNPYGLLITAGSDFVVADAGANALVAVTAGGTISTLAVLPLRPNPLPFGPPAYQAVPTAVALGPDGAAYASQLTGFPYPLGAANVYRLDPLTGAPSIALSGFTNIIDVTFAPDGSLYVLQITTNGLASAIGPGPGALISIDPVTGAHTMIASAGLSFPTALAVGPDGALYVSNLGTSPETGQVLRITAIPEPGTWVLLGSGLLGWAVPAFYRRCRGTRWASWC